MPPARIAAAAGMAAFSLALCGSVAAQKSAPAPAPPPPRIEGIVRDAAGKAVEKALVMARLAGDRSARTLSARADATGRFMIEAPKAGLYYLRIEAAGLAPHTVERLAVPGTALAVTLRKGGAIEGVVRDSRGKPVAGARVESRAGIRLGTLLSEPEAGRVRATTDAKGAFRLEGLATAPHSVTATAPGLGGARRDPVVPGAKLELFLTSGASLQGVVRGPDRRPLAGASVLIAPQSIGSAGSTVERTDAAGVFQAWGLQPGTWAVIAAHPDHAPAVEPVFLERNAEQRVDLALGAPARIRGRLVDGENRPVRGALLVVQEVETQVVAQSLGEMLRTESDAQGRFTLERAPRAPLALGVTAQGYIARRVDAAPEAADLDLGDVVMDSGLAIRGRVRDAARRPVADAQVRAMVQARGPERRLPVETTSAADGTFVLAGADTGLYNVTAEAAGFAVASTQASAGGEPVELTLEQAGSITGTVVDEKGVPVPAFDVTATPVEETGGWRPARSDGTEGRFELADVGSGDWNVRVKAPDKAEGHVSGVKVRPGVATDAGRIRLSPGAAVRGRVADSAGTPVAGAGVWTDAPGRFQRIMMRAGQRGTFTDASGAFELLGVEPGRVDVVAEHPDFASARATGVDVDAARGASDVRVTLGRGGRIEGTARRRDGRPLERATVRVMSTFPTGPGATAPVAPDGTFTIEHVTPGAMHLILAVEATGAVTSLGQQKQLDVREGETSVADFLLRDILVSGTITRRGEAGPGLRVALRGMSSQTYFSQPMGVVAATPTGPQYGSAVTRGDGSYELLVTDPGPHMATVTSADGRINYPMQRVEVPDADTATADFAFGGVVVSGQVVDAETSAPLSGTVFASLNSGEDRRPANAQAGADGRFQLELDPGDYTLTARADGYAAARSSVSVGESGAADVRLALTRGLGISGRILGSAGHPVGSLMVTAHTTGDPPPGTSPTAWSGLTVAAADGTFTINGLSDGSYNVGTGDELAGFATVSEVAAGSKNVVLRLSPGGRVRASVVNVDGLPVPSVFVGVSRVDGRRSMGSRPGQTDAAGIAELATPAGTIELSAGEAARRTEGAVTVTVPPGETVAVQLKLAPRKKDPGTR